MADRYLYVGEHADTLASGRPVAPGDRIPASALDEEHDKRFLDEGLLIDDRGIREEAKADAADKEATK
jgi:hypothetical protein